MESGFRAAQAWVEITTDLDGDRIALAARQAAEGIDRELTAGAQRTGQAVSDSLARAAGEGAERATREIEGRMRDSRGRFVKVGEGISDDVHKGVASRSRRDGPRAFLSFAADLGKGALQAGTAMGKTFGQGFEAAGFGSTLRGVLVTAVIATAPLTGTLLASGMVAGLGGGVIAGGIALALQDPEIRNAAAETGEEIGDILKDAAAPFKPALLDALDSGRAAIGRWEPQIRRAFLVGSTLLDDLVDGVTDLGDNALPSMVETLERAGGPIFDSIKSGLGQVGEAVGRLFGRLRDNGPELAAAMRVAFFLMADAIDNVGRVLNFLTETFGVFLEMLFRAGRFFVDLGGAMQALPGPLGQVGQKMMQLGGLIGEGETKWNSWKDQAKAASTQVTPGMEAVTERGRLMNQTMAASIREANGLSNAFKLLNGGALSAREAESAYQAAIDAVSASIKENGKTLDLHTAKGRANDAAIRSLIQATDQKAQATYNEVNATKGSQAAQAAAAKVYEQGRAQLIKNLTQILGNATAARKMADQIMAIPKSWSTDVKVNDQASTPVGIIQKRIDGLHGKTVTVAVKYETRGSIQGEHIIGVGTLTKASGGWIKGGSGVRDDVPVLAMDDEFVIRQRAARAIERRYPGFLDALNNFDRGGMPQRAVMDAAHVVAPEPAQAPSVRPGGSSTVQHHYHFGTGSIVLDASKIRDVADLVRLVKNLTVASRTFVPRGVSVGSTA